MPFRLTSSGEPKKGCVLLITGPSTCVKVDPNIAVIELGVMHGRKKKSETTNESYTILQCFFLWSYLADDSEEKVELHFKAAEKEMYISLKGLFSLQ